MKFGTIGAGTGALAFARQALAAGHQVVLSCRHGQESLVGKVAELGDGAFAAPVEKAASLDYVLLAVPWPNVEDALRGLPAWNGRVLIDEQIRSAVSPNWAGRPGGQRRERSGSRLGVRRPDREGVQFDRHRSLQ